VQFLHVCIRTHLHHVNRIINCQAFDCLQQNLHNILAPVVVVIVQHHLVDWGLLLAALGSAGAATVQNTAGGSQQKNPLPINQTGLGAMHSRTQLQDKTASN
jgi:hypothetical protein